MLLQLLRHLTEKLLHDEVMNEPLTQNVIKSIIHMSYTMIHLGLGGARQIYTVHVHKRNLYTAKSPKTKRGILIWLKLIYCIKN